MTNNLEISVKEIENHEYKVVSRLKGARHEINNVINQYPVKADGSHVFNCIKDYSLIEQILYEKLRKDYDGAALPLASAIASSIASDNLGYPKEAGSSFFESRNINYNQPYPISHNDSIEVYKESMRNVTPIPQLEALTESFFNWIHKKSGDEALKYPDVKNNPEWIVTYKNKKYIVDLKEKKEGGQRNATIDVEKYFVKERSEFNPDEYIAGHEEIKKEFDSLILRVENREKFLSRFEGRRLFPNYLLAGPPGTGKTTLVNGLANRCGFGVVKVPCVNLFSKYYSESASNVHDVYEKARKKIKTGENKGVIIIFDEIDHITKRRGYGGSPENDSLITTLNENLEGNSSMEGIITIGATNCLEMIDPAIVSRFMVLEVGYPKTDEGVIKIHQAVMSKMEAYAAIKNPEQSKIFGEIDFSEILGFSQNDERYKSGRIIDRILQTSAIQKQEENIAEFPNIPLVNTKDLVVAYELFTIGEKEPEKVLGFVGKSVLNR